MATTSLSNGVDLPIQQQLAVLPYTYSYHGSCMVSDGKRYIYWLPAYAQTTFYKYDVFTDSWTRLATYPGTTVTSGYTADMVYDPSLQRIYVVSQGSNAFYYYDIQAGAWSAALAVLPQYPYYAGQITHACSHRGAASDDFLYYVGGDGGALSRKLYKYTISTNVWSELGTDMIPLACSGGDRLIWGGETEPDKIYILRGATTGHHWVYTISTNTITPTQILKGGSPNFIGAGSNSCYDDVTGALYWCEYAERNINKTYLRTTALDAGTATAGAAKSLTDAVKAWEVDKWAGSAAFHVTITGGTGAGQTRKIEANTATALMVEPAWTVNPDATSTYEIKASVLDYGAATAGAATTLTDTAKAWIVNTWAYCKLRIIAGTGAGQERWIASNTATAITVTAAWATNPDATSKYELLGWKTMTEAFIPYAAAGAYYGNSMIFLRVKGLRFIFHARRGGIFEWYRWLSVTP